MNSEDRENKKKQQKNETLHPSVKPRSMNPLVNKPSVKVPPATKGSGKMKFVGNERGSKVERC